MCDVFGGRFVPVTLHDPGQAQPVYGGDYGRVEGFSGESEPNQTHIDHLHLAAVR